MREAQVQVIVRELAQRIRCARIAADLTQEQAAERSKIPYKRWQAIEAGAANVTVRTLARLANALGLTISELTGFPLPETTPRSPGAKARRGK